MSILNFISLGGGLALFLFGMNILAGGMEKISGGKVEKALEKLTSNIFTSVLLGAGVTALIQSSSVTTVIIVGMVNAGILKLQSAVGVIMGANIGTTVTVERLDNGARSEFVLVGSQEANPKAKPMRLSDESPFGKAVMGHHADEVVTVEAPAMSFQIRIISVTR